VRGGPNGATGGILVAMTVTDEEPPLPIPQVPPASSGARRRSAEAVHQVCPYLVAAGGGWRSVHSTRDHRCGATLPQAAPAVAKQREVCLVAAHTACATYRAARDLEPVLPSPGGVDAESGFWPETRGTLLALEPAKGRIAALPGPRGRTGGQALLVGLMVLAFLVLVIARTSPPSAIGGAGSPAAGGLAVSGSPGGGSPAPTGSASAGASTVPSAPASVPAASSATVSAAPSATASAVASPTPTAKPAKTPAPAGSTTYRVKSGDTLSSIAARFGTTVKKLKVANGIVDARVIHVGQVLVIP